MARLGRSQPIRTHLSKRLRKKAYAVTTTGGVTTGGSTVVKRGRAVTPTGTVTTSGTTIQKRGFQNTPNWFLPTYFSGTGSPSGSAAAPATWTDNFNDNTLNPAYGSVTGTVAEQNARFEATVVSGGGDYVILPIAPGSSYYASWKVTFPSGGTWNSTQSLTGMGFLTAGGQPLIFVGAESGFGTYFNFTYQNDSGVQGASGLGTIVLDTQYTVEAYFKRATAPGANDGIVRFWLNGVIAASNTAVDNDTLGDATQFLLGNILGSTTNQAIYIDDLTIGPLAGSYSLTGSGGLVAAGAATLTRTRNILPSGVLTTSGGALVTRAKTVVATGVVTTGGSTIQKRGRYVVPAPGADPNMPTGPELYYSFENGTGTTITDLSGNGHTGTFGGNAIWTTGKVGTWAVDGSGSTAGTTPPIALSSITLPNSAHSVAFWINWYDPTDGVVIGDATGYYAAYLDVTDWYYSNGIGNFVSIPHGGLTGWTHLAVTRVGTALSFYKNGSLLGTRTLASTNALTITSMLSYSTNTFPAGAVIDEVRVYLSALTLPQVTALYNYTGAAGTAGAVLSGAATIVTARSYAMVGTGGLVTSGAALVARKRMVTPSGTLTASGTSAIKRGKTVSASSGLITSGAAVSAKGYRITGSGSLIASGASAVTRGLVLTADTYASRVVADGALAYWRLNEPSGTIAIDSAPSPHNGTYSATGVTLVQSGALADGTTAALFNGTSGNMAAFGPFYTGFTQVSVEAWIDHKGVAWPGVHQYLTVNNQGSYVSVFSGAPIVKLRISGADVSAQSGTLISNAGWHHIVATWATGTPVNIYVDGVLKSSSANASGTCDTITQMIIGGTTGAWTAGAIDEVAIYPTALSAAQIANHYALRLAPAPTAITLSGAVTPVRKRAVVGSGTITMAGAATIVRKRAVLATGTATTTGTAAIGRGKRITATGTLTTSGAATTTKAGRQTGTGGAVTGGTSGLVRARALLATGGAILSGTAATVRRSTIAATGTLVTSGAAAVRRGLVVLAVGTALLSGSGSPSAAGTFSITGTGGLAASGTSAIRRATMRAASGGLVTSGTSTVSRGATRATSGSMVTSGSATLARARVLTGAGAMTLSGTATAIRRRVVTPSGGLVTSGTAAARRGHALIGTGTISTSGAGGLARGRALVSTGTALTSGTAIIDTDQVGPQTYEYTGSGGASLAGTATLGRAARRVGTGGAVIAGTASLSRANSLIGGGAATLSGTTIARVGRVQHATGTLVLTGHAVTFTGTAPRHGTLVGSGTIVTSGTAIIDGAVVADTVAITATIRTTIDLHADFAVDTPLSATIRTVVTTELER